MNPHSSLSLTWCTRKPTVYLYHHASRYLQAASNINVILHAIFLSLPLMTSLTAGPSAKFLEMPLDTLLTMNMLTPESWLVESVRTRSDLDNIKLSEVNVNPAFSLTLHFQLV